MTFVLQKDDMVNFFCGVSEKRDFEQVAQGQRSLTRSSTSAVIGQSGWGYDGNLGLVSGLWLQ